MTSNFKYRMFNEDGEGGGDGGDGGDSNDGNDGGNGNGGGDGDADNGPGDGPNNSPDGRDATPVGVSTLNMSDLNQDSGLDRNTRMQGGGGDNSRSESAVPQAPREPKSDIEHLGNAGGVGQDIGHSDPSIVTIGISMSTLAAFGVGVGADISEGVRTGGSTTQLEQNWDAYAVAGPIIGIPILDIPSLTIGISGASQALGFGSVDCSAMAMLVTPLFSTQVTWDYETGEFRSLSVSLGIALQLGFGGGMYCGFPLH